MCLQEVWSDLVIWNSLLVVQSDLDQFASITIFQIQEEKKIYNWDDTSGERIH